MSCPFNVFSVFAGIGGLELGLERADMTVVGQVEIDPYCRRVLDKHWPEVPKYDDVRTCAEWWLGRPRPRVDLICGGFPCQPVSVAGKQLAQADERWLWPAFKMAVGVLRPGWVLVENVPGLLARGMGDVLGDLATLGYDAEWDCVPAQAVGAPHLRDRVWIVGWDADSVGLERSESVRLKDGLHEISGDVRSTLAHANGSGWNGRPRIFRQERRPQPADSDQWSIEPDVGRVAHGVSARVDRLRALGNAVVPQVAEHVGRLILAAVAGHPAGREAM